MTIDYRFNNGHGAVLCRVCQIIIDEGISYDEAVEDWEGHDICPKCFELAKSDSSSRKGKEVKPH